MNADYGKRPITRTEKKAYKNPQMTIDCLETVDIITESIQVMNFKQPLKMQTFMDTDMNESPWEEPEVPTEPATSEPTTPPAEEGPNQ